MGLWLDEEATANPAISFVDGATLVAPESNAIIYWTDTFNATEQAQGVANLWSAETRTMRKMKIGDNIVCLGVCSSDTDTCVSNGYVQLFIKF